MTYDPTNSQNERFIAKILKPLALKQSMDFIAQNFQPEQVFTKEDLIRSVRKNLKITDLYSLEEITEFISVSRHPLEVYSKADLELALKYHP